MALFSNFVSFILFTILLFSLQINARDSQFFSKFSHANNNGKESTYLPNKEEPVNKPEQEPVFIPETDNNYGLYGHHESGQLPPATTTTTTTTYQPYKTESEEHMSKYPNNKYSYYNRDAYNTNQNNFNNNNNNYFNKDAYGNDLDNTRYPGGGYESVPNLKRKNQKYYYSNNGANDRYHYYGQRQGMSDTRFMEGGKYSYVNNNSMEGFQNQEFEGNINDFQP